MIKDQNSAYGAKTNCQRFSPCPLCYGCRNYNSAFIKCHICYQDNNKINICNVSKHTEKALNMMLRIKNKIKISKDIF